MTIHEELASELKDAMRAKDRLRINVIRQVETEVTVVRTAPDFSGEVDDALYTRVLKSYVKKMAKARKEYEAAGERGAEHAATLAFEVEYLGRWLPQKLSADETRALVRSAISEIGADDPGQTGQVIGAVMRSGKDLDGGLVSAIVREELGA